MRTHVTPVTGRRSPLRAHRTPSPRSHCGASCQMNRVAPSGCPLTGVATIGKSFGRTRTLCRRSMASAPSASALSAVVRCRGTILKRNPQSKRPAARVYGSLGVGHSSVPPARADLLFFLRQGEREPLGRRRVTLAFVSHHHRVKSAGDKSCELGKLRHSAVAQSSGSAHLAVHDKLVSQVARGLLSFLPSGGVVRTVAYRVRSSSSWEVAHELGAVSPGALKVSLTSHGSAGNSGHAPCFVTSSWTTMKKAWVSLTALVSEVMCSSLALVFCSSSSKAAQLDRKQPEESDQQVNI